METPLLLPLLLEFIGFGRLGLWLIAAPNEFRGSSKDVLLLVDKLCSPERAFNFLEADHG